MTFPATFPAPRPVSLRQHRPALPPLRRDMPIQSALEWAFATERASLDFDEAKGDNARPGVSPLWTVMQRGQLGCQVDGGGWSAPARDADIIASAVAHLPQLIEGQPAGRRMALRIAELARAGMAEDWGKDLRPCCVPRAWKCENQYGRDAATEVVGTELVVARDGRQRPFPLLACPVTYTATADSIRRARAAYHRWCDALAWLALDLRRRGILDRISITSVLPDPEPWVTVGQMRRVG